MPKITILIAIALIFFTVPNSFAVEPEIMEVTEFEFIKVIEPEFIEVTEFEILEPFVSSDALTKWGGEPKSVEYLMCAPLKGFPTPEKCLYEGQ